jgi:hypothetical protein
MPDMTPAPRRRPLWRLFIMPALLVVAAAAWSAFWFYAASEVGVRADAWAAQEAKSGRVYACGKREVAGFPFRFEVRCDDAEAGGCNSRAMETVRDEIVAVAADVRREWRIARRDPVADAECARAFCHGSGRRVDQARRGDARVGRRLAELKGIATSRARTFGAGFGGLAECHCGNGCTGAGDRHFAKHRAAVRLDRHLCGRIGRGVIELGHLILR